MVIQLWAIYAMHDKTNFMLLSRSQKHDALLCMPETCVESSGVARHIVLPVQVSDELRAGV